MDTGRWKPGFETKEEALSYARQTDVSEVNIHVDFSGCSSPNQILFIWLVHIFLWASDSGGADSL